MQMSLALVGLLLAIGAINCQKNFEAVLVNSNLFGSATNDAAPGSPFWWMSKGSPFKRAVANGPPSQQFDVSSNPFLNRGNAKLYSAPGYLPPDQPKPQPTNPPTIPCTGNGRACVPKYQCSNGFIDANQFRGSNNQQCNAETEVCCTIESRSNAGAVQPIRQPTQPRQPPTAAPTTTRNSYIPPPAPTRSQPQPTPCAGSSVCVPQYQCQGGSIPRSNPAASRGPASSCLQPEVCCRIQEEPRPKPTVNVITYQTSPSTQRPYVSPAVQTPRPIITKKPFVGQQYVPPRDNEVPEGNNPIGQYLPPNQGEDEKSEPIPNQSNDSPASFRPPSGAQADFSEQQLPPVQCPAATNCTAPEYCAADGSISKTPVFLSPEQEAYRVPLSDCRDLSKGITGKCCRDLDYTDPWPTDLLRTGAFDANVLAQAFDDGQYRPNGNNGQRKRGEIKKSPNIFIPQQSQTTKSYTNAPFNPNAISSNNKPSVPQPSTPLNPFNNQPQVPFSSPSSPQPFFNAPSQTSQNFIPQTVVKPTKSSFVPKPFSQQAQQYVQSPQPSFETPSFTQQPNVPSESQFIQPEQPGFSPIPSNNQQFVQPQQSSFSTSSGPEFNQPQQPDFSPQSPNTAFSRSPSSPFQASFQSNQPGKCAVRDSQGLPRGYLPNETAFGEFPWQAMVLRESTKSILCGGAIIEKNVVATAASCVDGLRPYDVIVKAGEWKLGSNEEPKPFQTVRVNKITMHPAYQPTNLESDLALLHLENDLKYDQHIGAICLDEAELDLAGSDEECVTSGWGKENIKYHVSGSLPHSLAINPLSESECQSSLNSYNPNSAVCARAQGDPCDVDPGSALACTRGNGRYLLKGIYSTNSGCGSNQLMTFTKMDVEFLRGAGDAIKSLPINRSNGNGISGFDQRLQSAPNQPAQFSSFSSPSSTSQTHGYLPPEP